jgi:heme/copper-type cytochrome/quinol oxidase subunit 3
MVSRSPDASPEGGRLLLPALNTLIETTTKQTMAIEMHPPMIIFAMLVALILVSSLLAGYSLAQGTRRNWIQILCFAAVLSIAFYVILDLEFPRAGWIKLDDRALVELRQTMK